MHFGGNLGLLQRLVVSPRILYFRRIVFRLDQKTGWRQRDRLYFRRQGMGVVQLQIGGIDEQGEVWPRIPLVGCVDGRVDGISGVRSEHRDEMTTGREAEDAD